MAGSPCRSVLVSAAWHEAMSLCALVDQDAGDGDRLWHLAERANRTFWGRRVPDNAQAEIVRVYADELDALQKALAAPALVLADTWQVRFHEAARETATQFADRVEKLLED